MGSTVPKQTLGLSAWGKADTNNRTVKSQLYPVGKKINERSQILKEEIKLYSISEDNYLMEYDLEKSREVLVVQSFTKIENQFYPLSLLDYQEVGSQEHQLLISNSGKDKLQYQSSHSYYIYYSYSK